MSASPADLASIPKRIAPSRLRRECRPETLGFRSTEELPAFDGLVGQSRALEALDLGARIEKPGFNMFILGERGTARHGYSIWSAEQGGEQLGVITSGSLGPTVNKNIALGYLPLSATAPGTRVFVDCRGKRIAAQVVKAPFYRRPAATGAAAPAP